MLAGASFREGETAIISCLVVSPRACRANEALLAQGTSTRRRRRWKRRLRRRRVRELIVVEFLCKFWNGRPKKEEETLMHRRGETRETVAVSEQPSFRRNALYAPRIESVFSIIQSNGARNRSFCRSLPFRERSHENIIGLGCGNHSHTTASAALHTCLRRMCHMCAKNVT